jgi:hypothetical protein
LEPVSSTQKKASTGIVQVNLEGEAAEKFKTEMNPLEAINAKKKEDQAKWEHWMRLEIERKRRELQVSQ